MIEVSKENSALLKGVAILLVIANHIVGKIGQTPGSIFGAIGVSVFFMLSGYGLNESYRLKGVKNFWGKKVKHIWLPYVCLTIPAMLICKESVRDFLFDVTLIRPFYCYGWYLQILAIFYLLFYFSVKIKNKMAYFAYWLLAIIVFYKWFYDIAQINAFAFFMGICLSKYREYVKISRKRILFLSGFLALVGLLTFKLMHVENGLWLQRLQIIQISISMMLILLAIAINKKNTILIWIGTISYELYIVHGWIIDPMQSLSAPTILYIIPLIFLLSWIYNFVWKKAFQVFDSVK